jgi:hypothetical protein
MAAGDHGAGPAASLPIVTPSRDNTENVVALLKRLPVSEPPGGFGGCGARRSYPYRDAAGLRAAW